MSTRWLEFLAGSMILAGGIVLTVKNPWGPAPWDALHLAVAMRTGLSLGQANIATSVALLGVSLLLGGGWSIRWGTLLNIVLIGLFIDLYIALGLPDVQPGPLGLLYLTGGIFCLSLGSVLYTRAGYGAGPRDGLTLVLSQRVPFTVGRVRLALDLLAAATGSALGGPLGPATVAVVLGTGPTTDLIFRILGRGRLPNTVRIPQGAGRRAAAPEPVFQGKGRDAS